MYSVRRSVMNWYRIFAQRLGALCGDDQSHSGGISPSAFSLGNDRRNEIVRLIARER